MISSEKIDPQWLKRYFDLNYAGGEYDGNKVRLEAMEKNARLRGVKLAKSAAVQSTPAARKTSSASSSTRTKNASVASSTTSKRTSAQPSRG